MTSAAASEIAAAAEAFSERPLRSRNTRIQRVIVFAICVALGVASGFFGSKFLDRVFLDSDTLRLPWSLIWLVSSLLLATVVHELGHVVGALLAGWKVRAFSVMPFVLMFNPIRVRPAPATIGGDIGGFVLATPQYAQHSPRDILFYAGGPLANLVMWWFARDYALDHYGSAEGDMAGTFAVFNALMGVGNLIPRRTSTNQTDGKWIVDAIVRPCGASMALARVSLLSVSGMRPREWPQALLNDMQRGELSPFSKADAETLLTAWAADSGRLDDARRHLAAALQNNPASEPLRVQLLLVAALYVAQYERDLEATERIMSLVPENVPPGYLRHRVDGLIALMQRDWDSALRHAAAARDSVRSHWSGLAPDDLEQLDMLEKEAKAGAAVGGAPEAAPAPA